MTEFNLSERSLIISNANKKEKIILPKKVFVHRINLVKTLKKYIKKYYNFPTNKNNILYLSIFYLDIILSKEKINLTKDKNLKYLCLCCFLLSLKFLGNYDLSKDVIRNFCHNYKEEYTMFEIQCLKLLNYNLIYTTAFDYLNMMLNKKQNQLLDVCNSILNKICEIDLYCFYSPFYIAIAIIRLGKSYLQDKTYNYYDKYFNEQRVIFLYKEFNHNLNINSNKEKNVDGMYDEFLYEKNNSHMYYYNNRLRNFDNNNFSKINIITNNIIQNNIIIINGISNKENKENINSNNYCTNTCLKTINSNLNMNPVKIFVNKQNRNSVKNNFNYNTNTYRISKIKNKNETNLRYRNSFNHVTYYTSNRSLNKNYYENDKVSYRINNNTINSENIKHQNKSSTNLNRKVINSNRNSLNFTFLSNVPKEVLYKLSRNISKTLGSSIDKISVNKHTSFK